MSLVVPAVLSSSRAELLERLALLSAISGVSRIQIDVVDGIFATPVSWPYSDKAQSEQIGREMLPYADRLTYEIDLMCLDPERAVGDWLARGATQFTIHAESVTDLSRAVAYIKRTYGGDCLSLGVALNIDTNLSLIEPILLDADYVQFMGIARIGRQGQPFDERVLDKIRAFHELHPNMRIQVDGGVSLDNAKVLLALGVSTLIVGSGILKAQDPAAVVAALEAVTTPFGV